MTVRVTRRRTVGRGEAEEGGTADEAVVERFVVFVRAVATDVTLVELPPPGNDGCGCVSCGMGLLIGCGCVGMLPVMV